MAAVCYGEENWLSEDGEPVAHCCREWLLA